MEIITFKAYDDELDFISESSISGNVTYDTIYSDIPLNQSVVRTLDGFTYFYGNDIAIVEAQISIKGVEYSSGEEFIDWLRNDLHWRANYLGIGLNGNDINIGLGLGTDLTIANKGRLLNESGEGITKLEAPLVHNFLLKFEYKRV